MKFTPCKWKEDFDFWPCGEDIDNRYGDNEALCKHKEEGGKEEIL